MRFNRMMNRDNDNGSIWRFSGKFIRQPTDQMAPQSCLHIKLAATYVEGAFLLEIAKCSRLSIPP